jgi:hypothetical protein
MGIATRVWAIPLKGANTRVREYLTREEMEAILVSIDPCALARMARLRPAADDVQLRRSRLRGLRSSPKPYHLGAKSCVQLHGKGSKSRHPAARSSGTNSKTSDELSVTDSFIRNSSAFPTENTCRTGAAPKIAPEPPVRYGFEPGLPSSRSKLSVLGC